MSVMQQSESFVAAVFFLRGCGARRLVVPEVLVGAET